MAAWGSMILRLSARFQELSFSGDGSRSRMPPGLSFGNKIMPTVGGRRTILECQDKSGAPTFGTLLGRIKALFSNTVSGKSEEGTSLDFWRTAGNRNPTYRQLSRVT